MTIYNVADFLSDEYVFFTAVVTAIYIYSC